MQPFIGRFITGLTVLLPLVAPTPIPAQCGGLCGDLNSNGVINAADIILLNQYLTTADSSGMPIGCANVDDHAGINLRDLLQLAWYIFPGTYDLDCDIAQGPVIPLANSSQRLRYNSVFPAGDSTLTLYIDAWCDFWLGAIALTLKVSVEGATPSLVQVTTDPSAATHWNSHDLNGSGTGNIPAGHLMGVFARYIGAIPPAHFRLGRAQLHLPPADHARLISIEQVELPTGSNQTMVNEGGQTGDPAWALISDPWIIELTGDINNDRVITASDLIGLVNFTFKGGTSPYPFAASGDANCSGTVTSADIVRLVDYVFKSGTTPCDVATECTLTMDSWSCP